MFGNHFVAISIPNNTITAIEHLFGCVNVFDISTNDREYIIYLIFKELF